MEVKPPRGNDASSSAKVFASTRAAAYLSLRFSGGQLESESDHSSLRGAELESTRAIGYRVFALSPRKTKQVEFALAMCLPS